MYTHTRAAIELHYVPVDDITRIITFLLKFSKSPGVERSKKLDWQKEAGNLSVRVEILKRC